MLEFIGRLSVVVSNSLIYEWGVIAGNVANGYFVNFVLSFTLNVYFLNLVLWGCKETTYSSEIWHSVISYDLSGFDVYAESRPTPRRYQAIGV